MASPLLSRGCRSEAEADRGLAGASCSSIAAVSGASGETPAAMAKRAAGSRLRFSFCVAVPRWQRSDLSSLPDAVRLTPAALSVSVGCLAGTKVALVARSQREIDARAPPATRSDRSSEACVAALLGHCSVAREHEPEHAPGR